VQPIGGQELPLKRELPGEASLRCPPTAEQPPEPATEERAQAERLGSTAAQALILGDTERARDLLARATELDPSSPELAYQYGRALESLDDASGALGQYCRVLDLDPDWSDADEVRARIDAVAVEGAPSSIAPEALLRFREGVDHGVAGRLEEGLQAFRDAGNAAPAWPDPVYNQGVVLLRLGRQNEAADALSRYLEMSPLAPDAIAVSQRLGQLQASPSRASPGAALTLGLIFPGMGQFYSGRPGAGFTFLALAGGAAAAGWFVEEVQVRCFVPVPPGEECPEEFVQSRTTEQPYLVAGLVAAGAITVVGAVEAWINARGRRRSDRAGLVSIDLGHARLSGFAVASHGGNGGSVDLDWVRISF
jgi:regulator of sirC expression with transglutaminase-like and TPR domain